MLGTALARFFLPLFELFGTFRGFGFFLQARLIFSVLLLQALGCAALCVFD